ncbi:hypothetical protein [Nonomuraea angiospora]
MKRMVLIAVFLLLGLAGVAVIPMVAYAWKYEHVCDEPYERVEQVLATFDVLAAHPSGAVAQGARESSCDSDDPFASVEQSYRMAPGGRREDVVAHYREIALRHGWKAIAADSPDQEECLVKEVGDDKVNLTVDFGAGVDADYRVGVDTWPC